MSMTNVISLMDYTVMFAIEPSVLTKVEVLIVSVVFVPRKRIYCHWRYISFEFSFEFHLRSISFEFFFELLQK